MHKCKITVLKRLVNQELIDQYMGDEYRVKQIAPCTNLEDGQEFVADSPGAPPEGFCAWAWANIHKEIGNYSAQSTAQAVIARTSCPLAGMLNDRNLYWACSRMR